MSNKDNEFSLRGIWIYQDSTTFELFEIIDSSSVKYYGYANHEPRTKKYGNNSYWFDTSKCQISFLQYGYVSIKTSSFRYYFRKTGDTLILQAECGDWNRFIRVHTEDEKAFMYFYSNDIKGIVQRGQSDSFLFVTKRLLTNPRKNPKEDFKNYLFEYDFSDLEKTFKNYNTLNKLASDGDSIIKPAFSDTLVLLKSKTKEYIKIAFNKK